MRSMVFAAVMAIAACSKPQPPEITVKDAKVTAVDMVGLTVSVNAEAFNPNNIPLTIQRVSGSAKIDGKVDLGVVTVSTPMNLPAGARTPIAVPLTMKWQNVTALTSLAAGAPSVPYTVTGTVAVGGEKLSIELPFQVQGTMTREQITQAAIRSIPLNLPGFAPK
jgi:LEA14-like dessication related protein